MGALARAVGERSSLATPEQWVIDWFKGGTDTPSGINVTEDTALHYGPFFAGVRIISEDLGSLPFPLYESLDPRGKRKATEHPLYPVIHNEANPVMSSQTFRETLTGHAVMWGGGFAEIVRKRGVVRELWPLRPDRMNVKFNRRTRRLIYDYDDQSTGIRRKFLPDEILHIHGLGFDGVRGYSVLELARNSIGAGVASEQFGASFFGNAARPSGFLTHPGVLGDPARKNLRESIEKMHKGSQNTGRIALLEEGLKWEAIGIPPDDAQFLETRRFDVLDMARWLRLPPFMLAELGRATWNNIESEKIDYVTKSLRTWLTRWEQAVWMRLLDSEEQETFFAEHTIEGLLRGDTKSRFESYRIGREIGVYSADDINELENRNPLPEDKGTVYFVPLNWVPAPSPDEGTNVDPGRERHNRSAESRRRIARAFEPLLLDIEGRLAKIERNQVLRLVKKHLADPPRTAVTFEAAIPELST
ncbi:MAG: phage portal protein, partial [Gemmatimonadetes bacterium]|nr:phage portal protein [Gemmatimonadota bacterium]